MCKLPFIFAFFALISAAAANENDQHTRILAASCAACHGTNGLSQGGTPLLAGLDESYFIGRMIEYRTRLNSTAVMVQHAKGLTLEEITALAKYFSSQAWACPYFKRNCLPDPIPSTPEN